MQRPPFRTGLVTDCLFEASPCLLLLPLPLCRQHHFDFPRSSQAIHQRCGSRQKSSARRRNLELDTSPIGHFTTGTTRKIGRFRFFWFCCLCSQMALRSSRKQVDNVQVFQVELRLNVASKTFIPPSHSWNVVQS